MESTGEMETALRYYEAANDHLALVRVYCYLNNLEKVNHRLTYFLSLQAHHPFHYFALHTIFFNF